MNITYRADYATLSFNNKNAAYSNKSQLNVKNTLNPNLKNNLLVDTNYGSLQVKNLKVAFKGLPAPLPKIGPSLGEKITALFDIVKSNEVILVGSGLKKAMKDMENHIDAIGNNKFNSPFKKVIKKIYFVQEEKLKQTMGFSKNDGYTEYTNLSDKMTFIKGTEKNQKYFIKPNDNVYITNTDKLLTEGDTHTLSFNSNTKMIPNAVKEKYATIIDFTEDAEQKIKKINKTNLKEFTFDNTKKPKPLTFKDVGGMDSAIRDMKELIVFPIKHPEIKSSKNMNKAILLEGPPGTGKSLLGEATANESGAYYKYIKGSELDSKYVGESEANVRAIVNEARENQPAIIFIDEVDAIAKQRNGKDTYGEKVLNTWLAEMSESEKRGDDIYFIAATNNRNALDNAMTRAGRFGNIIHVGEPDLEGTRHILNIHKKDVPFDEEFDTAKFVQELYKNKAVGADIASAVEEAERFAKRRERIFEKIEEGTYTPKDMEKLRVKNEDFDNAISELAKRKASEAKVKERPPIGFLAIRNNK